MLTIMIFYTYGWLALTLISSSVSPYLYI